jgi:hypothetical protein
MNLYNNERDELYCSKSGDFAQLVGRLCAAGGLTLS